MAILGGAIGVIIVAVVIWLIVAAIRYNREMRELNKLIFGSERAYRDGYISKEQYIQKLERACELLGEKLLKG